MIKIKDGDGKVLFRLEDESTEPVPVDNQECSICGRPKEEGCLPCKEGDKEDVE